MVSRVKLVVLVALALCMTGVTLVAAAPAASACTPPNCPGFGRCELKERDMGILSDVYVPQFYLECYY